MSEPFKEPFNIRHYSCAVEDYAGAEVVNFGHDSAALKKAQWLCDRLNLSSTTTTPPPTTCEPEKGQRLNDLITMDAVERVLREGDRPSLAAAFRAARHRLMLSTTPHPAPEREAFETWAATEHMYLARASNDDDSYLYAETHGAWRAWQARASSPAPALERRVPGGPACPTCGFKITVGKKPPFMSDDDPAPALELTAEDREQIRQARVRDPQVHREALSIHERDRRNLLAIIARCFPRLTTPADGEGDRLTHESADAPDERTAMELRYGLREEDLP